MCTSFENCGNLEANTMYSPGPQQHLLASASADSSQRDKKTRKRHTENLQGTSQKCGVPFLFLKWRKYRIYGLPGGFGGLIDRNEIA